MSLRLAFMGSPEFAVPTLEAILSAGHDVACVYSQPPRPAGRGKQIQRTPVHEVAERHGLTVRTPEDFRKPADREAFAALNLDVAVVVAYGLLLPKPILDAPRLGCFVHRRALDLLAAPGGARRLGVDARNIMPRSEDGLERRNCKFG